MKIISDLPGIQNSFFRPAVNQTSTTQSFGNILKDAMEATEQTNAQDKVNDTKLLTGDINDLHSAMLDMEKSELALQFTVQIRNKLLDAYSEIMRMQV